MGAVSLADGRALIVPFCRSIINILFKVFAKRRCFSMQSLDVSFLNPVRPTADGSPHRRPPMTHRTHIRFVLNGREVTVPEVGASRTLLDFLRLDRRP